MDRSHSFQRPERLRSESDFQQLYAKGKRLRGSRVNLLYRRCPEVEASKWGVAVGRRFGSAVRRNRAKRLVREVVRHRKEAFPFGYHLVVEIHPKANEFSQEEFRGQIEAILDRGIGYFNREDGRL